MYSRFLSADMAITLWPVRVRPGRYLYHVAVMVEVVVVVVRYHGKVVRDRGMFHSRTQPAHLFPSLQTVVIIEVHTPTGLHAVTSSTYTMRLGVSPVHGNFNPKHRGNQGGAIVSR